MYMMAILPSVKYVETVSDLEFNTLASSFRDEFNQVHKKYQVQRCTLL